MTGELTELEFSLEDRAGNQTVTPGNVDIPTLREFLVETEKLIKGSGLDGSLSGSRLRLEEGSVRIVACIAAGLAASVRTDIARLQKRFDLDEIDPKRAEILEAWHRHTLQHPTRTYSISGGRGEAPLTVSLQTRFERGHERAWVGVEKYLTGRIVDAGGKQAPNIHLVLSTSGETVKIAASEEQLRAETENRLYHDATVRVHGEQNLRTRALRELRLIEFVAYSEEVDEASLRRLWEDGRRAWRDVTSPAQWVDELRGNR